MSLPESVLREGVLRIDWTSFSSIAKCWRAGWHRVALNRVPAAWNGPQGFGRAIHAGLDARQKAGSGPYAPSVLAAMEQAALAEFKDVQLGEDEWKTPGRAVEVLGLYQQEYPEEPFDILGSEMCRERELGVMRVEGLSALRTPLAGDSDWHKVAGDERVRIFWQGRTDGLWRDRRSGRVAVKDTKTTEYYDDPDAKRREFKLSPQMVMYCWLFSDGEFGQIRDAVIDLIVCRKPIARQTAKSKPRNEFARFIMSYTDAQIEECKRGILQQLSAWLSACAQPEPPAMTGAPFTCVFSRGGCPYLQVCEQADERSRMAWLNSGQFKASDFDPMKL